MTRSQRKNIRARQPTVVIAERRYRGQGPSALRFFIRKASNQHIAQRELAGAVEGQVLDGNDVGHHGYVGAGRGALAVGRVG